MGQKRTGDPVNIECDVIARYVYRLLTSSKSTAGKAGRGKTLLEQLEGAGF
jgi:riboflavin synthase alpha subunit